MNVSVVFVVFRDALVLKQFGVSEHSQHSNSVFSSDTLIVCVEPCDSQELG